MWFSGCDSLNNHLLVSLLPRVLLCVANLGTLVAESLDWPNSGKTMKWSYPLLGPQRHLDPYHKETCVCIVISGGAMCI